MFLSWPKLIQPSRKGPRNSSFYVLIYKEISFTMSVGGKNAKNMKKTEKKDDFLWKIPPPPAKKTDSRKNLTNGQGTQLSNRSL